MGGTQILLSPNRIWSALTQEVEVQVSDDGEGFAPVFPCAELRFDPAENGNAAYIPFPDAVQGQYVCFRFFSNTETTAGQAAEIEIYAPQK